MRRRFEEVAAEFDVTKVEPIACFEVQQRETGTPWIMLRHTGENGGRGVVSWSGLAASRFRGREPALQALDLCWRMAASTIGSANSWETTIFRFTTLDRLLSARDVRTRLGFDVKNRTVVSELVADELIKPLRRIVIDLAEKRINVSQLKNKTQQIAYVDGFEAASKPNLVKRTHLRPLGDVAASEFKKKSMPAKRATSHPPERKAAVPRGLKLNLTGKPASIFQELRTLKLDEAPNAIAVAASRLSRTVSGPLSRTAQDPVARTRCEVRARIRQEIEAEVGGNDCALDRGWSKQTRVRRCGTRIAIKHSPLNIDLLNDYVHTCLWCQKRADLMAAWDEAQPLFEGSGRETCIARGATTAHALYAAQISRRQGKACQFY